MTLCTRSSIIEGMFLRSSVVRIAKESRPALEIMPGPQDIRSLFFREIDVGVNHQFVLYIPDVNENSEKFTAPQMAKGVAGAFLTPLSTRLYRVLQMSIDTLLLNVLPNCIMMPLLTLSQGLADC